MVKVAIAGGTGVVGKTLVEVLAGQSNHDGIVLTRKKQEYADQILPHFVVDYENVASLTAFLQEHDVHTIISAFGINGSSLTVSQMNLIKAANNSTTTKRFIPSSFAIAYPQDGPAILPPLKAYFNSLDALAETQLEWATVHNGIFLDYFAPDTLKSYYDHGTFIIDMVNAAAAIPGTGNELVTLTYTFDVARFLVASLDLPKWPRELRIIGETLTLNELIKLAEVARGKKFDVVYDSLEKLRSFQVTELPSHKKDYGKYPKEVLLPFLSIFERWIAEGLGKISREESLNEEYPNIRPLTATELMGAYWNEIN
ncbi:NmrA-like family protein [Pyrenochaeta sp. DS3sAY3a]|nr:NmrA-like family protein [Pyrenochaeta sp. DS3sAY3a]